MKRRHFAELADKTPFILEPDGFRKGYIRVPEGMEKQGERTVLVNAKPAGGGPGILVPYDEWVEIAGEDDREPPIHSIPLPSTSDILEVINGRVV